MGILERLIVINNPKVIKSLTHKLTFASDTDVNDMLLTRFGLYEFLYLSDKANTLILQNCINKWSNYFNQLYKTTIFEYNPIENYNIEENGNDNKTITLNGTDKNTLTHGLNVSNTFNYGKVNDTELTHGLNVTTTTHEGLNGINSTAEKPELSNIIEGQIAESINSGIDKTKSTDSGTDKSITQNTGSDTSETTHNSQNDEAYTHSLTRHGNIGVMSTQNMIRQEREIIINILSDYVDKFATCFNVTM